LSKYESERLTAVPKHIPRTPAISERMKKVFPINGTRNTVIANKILNTRK